MKFGGSWYVHSFLNKYPWLNSIVSGALNVIPGCQIWCSALFNASSSYVATGSLNAAFKAGAISYASGYVSQGIAGAELGQTQRIVATAATSRATAELQGDKPRMGTATSIMIAGASFSAITGGKFTNGGYTVSNSYSQAVVSLVSNSKGRLIFPEGKSQNINDYVGVQTNGILGDEAYLISKANELNIPVYFNPSAGLFFDVSESVQQKYAGWMGDNLARDFSRKLAGVDHPLIIIAHSQGTLTVANAARYYGLPRGSTLVLKSPAISYSRATAAATSIGGELVYIQPYGDIANLYAPSFDPVKWWSGINDIFCGACTHKANGLP